VSRLTFTPLSQADHTTVTITVIDRPLRTELCHVAPTESTGPTRKQISHDIAMRSGRPADAELLGKSEVLLQTDDYQKNGAEICQPAFDVVTCHRV
jgi:hypothetical protein